MVPNKNITLPDREAEGQWRFSDPRTYPRKNLRACPA